MSNTIAVIEHIWADSSTRQNPLVTECTVCGVVYDMEQPETAVYESCLGPQEDGPDTAFDRAIEQADQADKALADTFDIDAAVDKQIAAMEWGARLGALQEQEA